MEKQLVQIYERLYSHFGAQHWWPGETQFEIIVGAILTQNTSWTNVEKAIANLKQARLLTPERLHAVDQSQLAQLIRPSGYFNLKTIKLHAFTQFLFDKHHGKLSHLFKLDLMQLRDELLGVYGIGPETADSIILYAAHKPIFVVDTYTRRIFARLGLSKEDATYTELQEIFMRHLPRDEKLFNEYHALIVALGKDVCKKSNPACDTCPLRKICAFRQIEH